MSVVQPGGALFQLPRETRDEIYRHCLSKSYLVFRNFCESSYWGKRKPADFGILRSSKAISTEVQASLFCRAASTSFLYSIEFDHRYMQTVAFPHIKEATERMMNVGFSVFLSPAYLMTVVNKGSWYPDASMRPICEATVDHFIGTTVIRDTCWIELYVCGPNPQFRSFMKTRFFQTLKRFNGFKTMTVMVNMGYSSRVGLDVSAWSQMRSKELQMELESHLGPSVVKPPTGTEFFSVPIILELKFHPVNHHVQNFRAEAAKLTKEADRIDG